MIVAVRTTGGSVVRFASLVVLLLAPALAAAADPPAPPARPAEPTLQWSLGVGVISAPRPYVDSRNETLVIPLVGLDYKRLYVQGIRLGYHLVDQDRLKFDVRARYVFDGLDPADSPFLDGMAERQGTVEAGLGVDWRFADSWSLGATAFTDVLGRSDGQELGLDLARTWTFGRYRWGLTPAVGVIWQSSDLVDYYYGVPPEEATPVRPAYAGASAIDFRASLLFFYRISDRINAIALVQARRLDDEIVESPIVDERSAIFGLVGLSYQIGGQGVRAP
jgi:outer membrane protein